MDEVSAYAVRKAILARYGGEEITDLAVLRKKCNDVITSKKKE
jgi:hypothetical protein